MLQLNGFYKEMKNITVINSCFKEVNNVYIDMCHKIMFGTNKISLIPTTPFPRVKLICQISSEL